MPIYEYRCGQCEKHFDATQSVHPERKTPCALTVMPKAPHGYYPPARHK